MANGYVTWWCVCLQEIATLAEALPLSFDSSIAVAVDEEHLDLLR
jgi:hypothetical protein